MALRGEIVGFDAETEEITVRVSELERLVISLEDRSNQFSVANPPRLGEEVLLHFGYDEEDTRKPHSILWISRVIPSATDKPT